MDAKTTAIVAHITVIGLIIAVIYNNKNKSEFASFYIRQNLGLGIAAFLLGALSRIPVIGFLAGFVILAIIALWVISLINAVSDKQAPLPIVGPFFQDVFSSL